MMSSGIDYATAYLDWLHQNIDQYKISETVSRMTLPYLDVNNDEIDIYIIDKKHDGYYLTDDGEILNNLDLMGFKFSKSRRRLLENIIASYGVCLSDKQCLYVECGLLKDIPMKMHLLAQCMIKISDLFFLNRNSIRNIFTEDVKQYLEQANIRYVPNISIRGKSRLPTQFDFVIGHSQIAPERLIKVINNLTNSSAKNIIFEWSDTREVRDKNSLLYSFIQDTEGKVPPDAIGALQEYGIKPVLWSDRESVIAELAA